MRIERQGTLIRVDKNGTKYFTGVEACDRCGGAGGADKWRFTGFTCYKCGGTGTQPAKWKEYTPEYEAKLEERRAKRRAKWLEEHKEELEAQEKAREEKRQQEEAERRLREEAERLEAERKAKSEYFGEIGQKVDLTVTLIKEASFEIQSFRGFGTDTVRIFSFRDEEGHTFTWKTQGSVGWWTGGKKWEGAYVRCEAGDKIRIKATIKAHNEYKDEKQTELLRVKAEPLG